MKKPHPHEVIVRAYYLPDGRVLGICARRAQVLDLLTAGLKYREIGIQLRITASAAAQHVEDLKTITRTRSSFELAFLLGRCHRIDASPRTTILRMANGGIQLELDGLVVEA